MQKFERQNQDLAISIYGWSEKHLIPIRIAPKTDRKLIRLLLISGVDPITKEDAQYYCLIKGREGLGRLAGYTTKHERRLYVCDWCVSHRTHDPKIDAKYMEDCAGINNPPQSASTPEEGKNIYGFKRYIRQMDVPFIAIVDAECFTKKVKQKQGAHTEAIQEHEPASFDY